MEIQLKPYFEFCTEHSAVLRRLFDEWKGMTETDLLALIRATVAGRDAQEVLVEMRDRWRLIEARDDDATRFRLTSPNRRFLGDLFEHQGIG